uniref:Serine/threonine-protein phosphatase 6 regulatory ankyrin repeat subunit B n=1 Tax=Lygus hesperus TaxID=30085 RepID=A0A0A9WM61_LYGHE
MGIYVEKRLLDLRFFDKSPRSDIWQRLSMQDIMARYDYLTEKIDETVDFGPHFDDFVFQYKIKFITQNIHVLKRLLKSTMVSIPWEEIEFSLIVFLRTKSTTEEINMIFESVITKRKLLMHMQNFSTCLKSHRAQVASKAPTDVKVMPAIKRDDAIRRITNENPPLMELYCDYETCRDIQSLDAIRKYADLAKSANPEEKNGRLVIIRALQVLGEYTKNTLMSPKMSETTGKRLISNMGGNGRKIVADIRNALSHSFSLIKRTELEDSATNSSFFLSIQNDLRRVNNVITNILFFKVFQVMKRQLEKLLEAEEIDEISDILTTFRFFLNGSSLIPNEEDGTLQKLVTELCNQIPNPNIIEIQIISEIKSRSAGFNNLIVSRNKFIEVIAVVVSIDHCRDLFGDDGPNKIRSIKFTARKALNSLCTSSAHQGIDNKGNSMVLGTLVIKLLDSMSNRLTENEYYDLFRVAAEILHIIQFEDDVGAIEELRYELKTHNAKFKFDINPYHKQPKLTRNTVCKRMVKKIEALDHAMSSNKSCKFSLQSLLMLRDDRSLMAAIEMLSLDILSILGSPLMDRLNDNLFSIETHSPTLFGKSLRNHIAHGNDIVGFLTNDPTTPIVLNAAMFIQHDIAQTSLMIGQLSWSGVTSLQEKDTSNGAVIDSQQLLFQSLRDGDMVAIERAVSHGADIAAKTADGMTALHFAAMCSHEESLAYTLKQWKGTITVRNIVGQNPFHIAARQGYVRNLKLLWARDKAIVETKDREGNTALHFAAAAGNCSVINYLLALKANVETNNLGGNTPLRIALFQKQVEASKILLKYYKPNSNPNGGFSPLHVAAEIGSIELVRHLLLQGENPKDLTDRAATALHLAALNGHTEVVEALITNGADVNARSSSGGTPLLFAVETNREDIVRTLLQSGADVNCIDADNFAPIFHAASNGNVTIAKILLEKGARVNLAFHPTGQTPLHYAVGWTDNAKLVELLLTYKALINAKDSQGVTPLHQAARCGHPASCAVLLNHGADTSIVDEYGRSSVFHAAEKGNLNILELLINARSNMNTADLKGFTPLHLACTNGHTAAVELLVNSGAAVNGNLTFNVTPLQAATMKGFGEIVEFLVSKGADIHQKSQLGFSALHLAAAGGSSHLIQCLVKYGAKINTVDSNTGYTPLHLACLSGHCEASKTLLRLGSRIHEKGKDGRCSLQCAVAYNYQQSFSLVKMLIKNGAVPDTKVIKQAIRSSSLDVVEFLLENCKRISDSSDLLLEACLRHHNGILKSLLKRGLDVNEKFNVAGEGWLTPVEFAASKGHEDVLDLLLEQGANPNVQGSDGETPLHKSAGAGHVKAVAALLSHKAVILIVDLKKRTALDLAIANGHIDIVKMMIDHCENIDVNRRAGNEDLSLLHVATQFGHIEIVKLLIEKGADINIKNSSGSKAIHFAARDGFPEIVELFLSKKIDLYDRGVGGNTLLHYTAQGSGDCLKVADMLINEKHFDVNTKNDNGKTPLHLAVYFTSNIPLIQFFLKHGAFFNSKAQMNIEPADMCSNPKVDCLFASIRKLFIAVKQRDLKNVMEIIQEEALVIDVKNNKNESPLLCAAWKGYEDIVDALLKNGANPNITGKSGSTALHYAAKSSYYNIIELLLGYGANFEALNDVGKVPMDYAPTDYTFFSLIRDSFCKVKSRDTTIIQLLRNRKWQPGEVRAVFNSTSNEGKTLMSAAMSSKLPEKCIEVLKILFAKQSRLERVHELLSVERYQEALDAVLSELKEAQLLFSRKSLMNIDAEILKAKILYKLQRYKEAFDLFTDLHNTLKEMVGEDDKQTLFIRMSIGLVLHREGRDEEALEIFVAVDRKQSVLLDQLDPQALETKSYMALVLDKLDKLDEALEINNYVLEKYKRIYGLNHPCTLMVQNNIAMMLGNKGKFDEALKLWNYVHEKRKKVLGPNHADTMRTKSNIASLYLSQGKLNEALNVNKEALSNQTSKLSSTDRDILGSKMNRAMALLRNGEFQGAMQLYQEVSKNKEHAGPAYGYFESVFSSISGILEDRGIVTDRSTTDSAATSKLERRDMFSELMETLVPESKMENQGDMPNGMNSRLLQMLSGMDGKSSRTTKKLDVFQSLADGDLLIVEEMKKNKVNFNIEDGEGRTPLHFAVSSGNKTLVASCIENGSKVNVKSDKGNTPLHTASLKGDSNVVQILLENVARSEKDELINAQTLEKGMTALHVASMKGHLEVVKLLLQNGANAEVYNKESKTPLDLSSNQDITSYLTTFEMKQDKPPRRERRRRHR